MTDEWTCGKGLAANSALPGDMASFFGAMATVLEFHTRALDLDEVSGRVEYVAYMEVVSQQRAIASSLATLAHEMASHVPLPMATHDLQVLNAPQSVEAFQALLDAETALLERLRSTVDEHRQMVHE